MCTALKLLEEAKTQAPQRTERANVNKAGMSEFELLWSAAISVEWQTTRHAGVVENTLIGRGAHGAAKTALSAT